VSLIYNVKNYSPAISKPNSAERLSYSCNLRQMSFWLMRQRKRIIIIR